MADFEKAYKITILANEGGYNPGKGEKETYMGIDRGANPHWSGWPLIDKIKADHPGITAHEMNIVLGGNAGLQADIKNFYKAGYWDTAKLDQVKDQQLANNLFDCSVNQGSGIACKFMQQACNTVIDSSAAKLPKLTVDLNPGVKTLSTFNSLSAPKLMGAINTLRSDRYHQSDGFAEWGPIWLNRLTSYV
jgi:lysozyme family protein